MMKETKMKRVPKLRFPEFTDDWEQRKLGDISEIKTGPFGSTLHADDYVSDGIPIITTEHFKAGTLPTDKCGLPQVSENDFKRLSAYVLNEGDIVFSRVGSVDINAIITPFQRNWLFSGRVLRVRPQGKHSSQFLHTLLENENVKSDIRTRAVGQTMPSINTEILKITPLLLPASLTEQELLGEYFHSLDRLITLHQRKLEKLKELRKGVMKKLFSQEVRFKADDGSEFPDWEEKKLGDDVQFINGRAYKQDELLNSGKYLVLRVGNLFTNDSYYYSDLELDNDKYIENGDLIYAWSATFGPRIYYGEKCIYHYHIWKLKFDENIISKIFLNYYLLYDVEKIKSQRTGGTMVHITKNAMEHRELQFPCLAEQQKIADCLSTLDDVIEKQKATLAAWEELKKGLLQQMFV